MQKTTQVVLSMLGFLFSVPALALQNSASPASPIPTGQVHDQEFRDEVPIRPLKETFTTEPLYTEEARQAGIEGTVVVYAEVTPTGFPENLQILRKLGYGLDEQALDAIQHWRFEPFRENGQPVRAATLIPLNFRLASGSPSTNAPTEREKRNLYKVGNGVTVPKVVSRVEPHYTEEARAAKLQARLFSTSRLPLKVTWKTFGSCADWAWVWMNKPLRLSSNGSFNRR